ncbi:CorA family divalent cation transporter [Streptomyces globosus]|uniref:CorA family divalent cation transporter n=1 Tax=Streptomyces globosus TaxID=68209 RepID=UPI001FE747B7|nr:CorA family divalent cation transporter [Streptomyces globosus]
MSTVRRCSSGRHDGRRGAGDRKDDSFEDRRPEQVYRLAIVSVVFLPLSFITGFFGMNFTFLTDSLQSRDEFWLLAVGLQVLVLSISLYVLHRTRIWRRLREDDW